MHSDGYMGIWLINADEIDEPQPDNQNYNNFEEPLLDFSYLQQWLLYLQFLVY